MQRDNPDLAARMGFVEPATAHVLRRTLNEDVLLENLQGIVNDRNGNDTARFLFLPVNDDEGDGAAAIGRCCSLIATRRKGRWPITTTPPRAAIIPMQQTSQKGYALDWSQPAWSGNRPVMIAEYLWWTLRGRWLGD
ncbi:PIN domain-containing protein [Bradyrhizobium elkanii]